MIPLLFMAFIFCSTLILIELLSCCRHYWITRRSMPTEPYEWGNRRYLAIETCKGCGARRTREYTVPCGRIIPPQGGSGTIPFKRPQR